MAISATAATLLLSLVAALATISLYSNPYKFDEPIIPLAGRLVSEVNVDGITRLCHDGDDACLLTGLSTATPDDANQIVYLKDIPTVAGGKELSKFRNGCGMSHNTNAAGDIVLSPLVTAGNGLYSVPGCGEGDPIILEVNVSGITLQLDVKHVSDAYITDKCAITHTYNNGTNSIEFGVLIAGNNGITVNACPDGGAQQLGLNGTAVVDTLDSAHFHDVYIAGLCGLTTTMNGDVIEFALELVGSDGVRIDTPCGDNAAMNIGLNGTAVVETLDLKHLVENFFADVCGITYDYDSTGNQIFSTLQFVGIDGVTIDVNCSIPGGPIEIGLNGTVLVETINISYFSETKLVATCGLEQVYDSMLDAIVVGLDLTSSDGVVLGQPCADDAALNIGLNGTALVDTLDTQYFSTALLATECGLSQVYDVMSEQVVFSLDLFSMDDSILFNYSCDTGQLSICVNESRILQNVNVSEVLDVLFEPGCGLMLDYIPPNNMIRFSTNLSGANGIIIDPVCGVGEAQIISLDSEGIVDTINITYFNELYINPLCGLSAVVNANMIDLALEITGSNGVRVDAPCGDLAALNIGLNGTEVIDSLDVKYLVETLFADVCGITYDYDSTGDQIFTTLQLIGYDGVSIDANCSIPGGAIEISLNGTVLVETLNTSYFSENKLFAECGITQVYDGMNDGIILSTNIAGVGGVFVDPSCPLGVQTISLDPNTAVDSLNISHVYELWFGDGCGVTTDLSMGVIYNNLNLINNDGAITIGPCAAGASVELSLPTVITSFGGTGVTTAPTGNLLMGNAGVWAQLTPGQSTYVLTSNGPTNPLSWTATTVGTVTGVTANAPLDIGGTAAVPNVFITPGTNNFVLTTIAGVVTWAAAQSGVTSVGVTSPISIAGTVTDPVIGLGVVPSTLGGTGLGVSLPTGHILVGSGGNTMGTISSASIATNWVLTMTAANTPGWAALPAGTLTGITAGTNIAVTPSPSPTSPTVSLTGTVAVTNGGTGLNTVAAGGRMLISHPTIANTYTTIVPGVIGSKLTMVSATTANWVTELPGGGTIPTSVTVLMSTTGNDANDGITNPVLTFTRALAVLNDYTAQTGTISIASGSYNLGANPVQCFFPAAAQYKHIYVQGAEGSVLSGTVTNAQASFHGPSDNWFTMTLSAGMSSGAFNGGVIFNVNTQEYYAVISNTATQVTIVGGFVASSLLEEATSPAFTNGHNYRIFNPGTTFTWSGVYNIDQPSGILIYRNIFFSSGADDYIQNPPIRPLTVIYEGCKFLPPTAASTRPKMLGAARLNGCAILGTAVATTTTFNGCQSSVDFFIASVFIRQSSLEFCGDTFVVNLYALDVTNFIALYRFTGGIANLYIKDGYYKGTLFHLSSGTSARLQDIRVDYTTIHGVSGAGFMAAMFLQDVNGDVILDGLTILFSLPTNTGNQHAGLLISSSEVALGKHDITVSNPGVLETVAIQLRRSSIVKSYADASALTVMGRASSPCIICEIADNSQFKISAGSRAQFVYTLTADQCRLSKRYSIYSAIEHSVVTIGGGEVDTYTFTSSNGVVISLSDFSSAFVNLNPPVIVSPAPVFRQTVGALASETAFISQREVAGQFCTLYTV